MGIDCEVEKRRTKDACLKLAKRYFRKGEAVERIETALAKEEDWGRRMFVRYWCLCESYVKALGVGISGRPFRNFDIAVTEKRNDDDEREDISLFESDPETFGRWRFQLFRETPTIKVKEDERSIVAVCVEDDTMTKTTIPILIEISLLRHRNEKGDRRLSPPSRAFDLYSMIYTIRMTTTKRVLAR